MNPVTTTRSVELEEAEPLTCRSQVLKPRPDLLRPRPFGPIAEPPEIPVETSHVEPAAELARKRARARPRLARDDADAAVAVSENGGKRLGEGGVGGQTGHWALAFNSP